jgi:hypothetical protein
MNMQRSEKNSWLTAGQAINFPEAKKGKRRNRLTKWKIEIKQ